MAALPRPARAPPRVICTGLPLALDPFRVSGRLDDRVFKAAQRIESMLKQEEIDE